MQRDHQPNCSRFTTPLTCPLLLFLLLIALSWGASRAQAAASYTFTKPIAPTWNLLATPLTPTDPAVEAVLAEIKANLSSVWKWTNNTWAVYLPGEANAGTYAQSKGFSTLTTINPGEGFWVNSQADATFSITGPLAEGQLSFASGWSLLGLKDSQATTVEAISAGTSGIVSIWKWQGDTWAMHLAGEAVPGTYAQGKGFSLLTSISPGEGFWVLIDNSKALNIADYFPKSGPAGSPVYLKMSAPVAAIKDTLTVYYNQQPVAASAITVGTDTIQFTLPAAAPSGDIQVKEAGSAGNTVPFTILSPATTPLTSQTATPSSTNQTIGDQETMAVTLPPTIIASESVVSLATVANSPANGTAPFAPTLAWDVTISGLEQLNDFIEITVKYDPALLAAGYSAEEQLQPMRWNAEGNYWIPLPYQVDAENSTISFYSDHLCIFEVVVITGLAVANVAAWTGIGEELLNDIYWTPAAHFKLMYSQTAIQADAPLEDGSWLNTTYAGPLYPIASYQAKHPKFIQDMGNLLEVALKSYVETSQFKDPITKPGWIWGTTQNPITVKMDSWWVAVGGNPNFEKVFEYIHYPTVSLKDFQAHDSYAVIGHELFHRIEAEYYGKTGFLVPANHWWLEAAAEYAGHRVAWSQKLDNLHDKTGSDFFSYPLTHTGVMANSKGWNLDQSYEYAASAFIQFLVEKKGLNFKELFAYVAAGSPSQTPLERLNGYQGVTLSAYYRDFTAWGLLCSDSFLKKYPVSAIADKEESIAVPEDQVRISFTGGQYSTVSVYKRDKTATKSTVIPTPDLVLDNGVSHELTVKADDTLYLIAENSGASDETIYVAVELMVKGEAKPGTVHTFTLKGGYSAKVWTIANSRYQEVAGSNGSIIKDMVTGLEWQRCSVGQSWNGTSKGCDGTQTLMDWSAAANLTQTGGWRTPTLTELVGLVYCTDTPPVIGLTSERPECGLFGDFQKPTIWQEAFPLVETAWFWTTSIGNEITVGEQYWFEGAAVSFYYGSMQYGDIANQCAVRLVRDGQ